MKNYTKILLCFICIIAVSFNGFSQSGHNHKHDMNSAAYIAEKMKNVQLVFNADSLRGFNEAEAVRQVAVGGAPEWEQKVHLSFLKRRYIDTKYGNYNYRSGGNPSVQAPC